MSLVEEIQARALNPEVSVSDLLRSAKLAASKLKLAETLAWVEHELNGYHSVDDNEVPSYRWTSGTLMAQTRYHGTRIAHGNHDAIEQLSIIAFRESTGALESYLEQQSDFLTFSISSIYARALAESGASGDFYISVGKSVIISILDRVRNNILDWAIKLEEQGIFGAGVSFTMDEKQKAANAGHTINITNLGHLHQGDVNGHQNRTTVNGTDASSNSLSADVFEQVQSAIANHVEQASDREILLELLQQMKDQKRSSGFRDLYGKFLVAAANHMTVLSPFLPALSAHLPG